MIADETITWLCSYIKEICFYTWKLNFILFLSHFLVNISITIDKVFKCCFLNVEATPMNIRRLNFHFQPNFNVETTLVHRRWIDVILSTLFQRCFANVETTSINVRRLNFHFQPNINVETMLKNVDDQRWCVCWEPCLFQNFAIVRISVYLGQKAYSESCFCRYTQAYYSIMIVIITFTFFFFHINLTYLSVKFEKTYVFWPQRH